MISWLYAGHPMHTRNACSCPCLLIRVVSGNSSTLAVISGRRLRSLPYFSLFRLIKQSHPSPLGDFFLTTMTTNRKRFVCTSNFKIVVTARCRGTAATVWLHRLLLRFKFWSDPEKGTVLVLLPSSSTSLSRSAIYPSLGSHRAGT